MLIVAGLSIVLLIAVAAWRANVVAVAYRLIMGRPAIVTYETWETFSCPEPGNPNRVCTKFTNTTQPAFSPPPTP
jgi:hypothetical protein